MCTLTWYLGFMGTFSLNTHLYCLVGCLSMIVWTHAVLGVLYASALYFCICTCPAQLSMFHMERHPRNTLIIIIVTITGNTRPVQTGHPLPPPPKKKNKKQTNKQKNNKATVLCPACTRLDFCNEIYDERRAVTTSQTALSNTPQESFLGRNSHCSLTPVSKTLHAT